MAAEVALDPVQVLRARPTANRAVREERTATGLVLFVAIARPAWLRAASWFLPLRREKGFALDRIGEQVWRACDGSRSLEAVVAEFAEHHRLRFQEARALVAQFLKLLSERNLVALVGADGAPGEDRPG